MFGNRTWYFPDGERPPVTAGAIAAHESLIVLNPNEVSASIEMKLFFTDDEPIEGILLHVPAQRVSCFRMNEPDQIGGVEIPEEVQYSIGLFSDTPIIAQYGRADTRQENLAFYTTMGYPGGR